MKHKIRLKYRIIMALAMLLIPMSALFFACYGSAVRQIEQSIFRANKNSLTVYHTQLVNEIGAAEAFLLELSGNLEQTPQEIEKAETAENIGNFLSLYNDISSVIWLDKEGDVEIHRFKSVNQTEEQTTRIETGLRDILMEGEIPVGWFVRKIDGSNYWIRIVSSDTGYAAGLVNINQLVRNAGIFYGVTGDVVLLQNNVPLTFGRLQEKENIQFRTERNDYYFSEGWERCMIVQTPLVGLTLALVVPFQLENYSFGWIVILYLIFIAVMLLCAMLVLLYLKKYVLRPTKILTDTMQEVGRGDTNIRIDTLDTPEFEEIRLVFNHMMDEILKLKIEKYEQQINMEKSKMETLRLQIRPHFYQNCLKSIYSMSADGNTHKMQRVIIGLANHLRYVFDIDEAQIPLKEELRLCENYVELQGQIGNGIPRFEMNVETELMEFPVPQVSLLTLVENSFKHGKSVQEELKICITAQMLTIDNQNIVGLTFRDNGSGFSAEQLKNFNAEQFAQGHIGVANVLKRFRLLYGNGFEFSFGNERGAKVNLMISLQKDNAVDRKGESKK